MGNHHIQTNEEDRSIGREYHHKSVLKKGKGIIVSKSFNLKVIIIYLTDLVLGKFNRPEEGLVPTMNWKTAHTHTTHHALGNW